MPVTHIKTDTIPDPTQADLDAQIALGNYPPGTLLSDIVLASDWNDNHVVSVSVSEIDAAGTPSGSTFLRGDGQWAAAGGSSSFTVVEKDLGTNPRRSGKFTITGLAGLTTNKPVNIFQAVGPYTNKGTLADEAEMDGLVVKAIVTAADTITAYWNSVTAVRGNFKFNYLVGA